MRVSHLLASAFIAIGAVALNEAAPAELLWLYSLYKAEWKVRGARGDREIAPGCMHDKVSDSSQSLASLLLRPRLSPKSSLGHGKRSRKGLLVTKATAKQERWYRAGIPKTGADRQEDAYLKEVSDAGLAEGICAFDEFVTHIGTNTYDGWQYTTKGHSIDVKIGIPQTQVQRLDNLFGRGLAVAIEQLFPRATVNPTRPWSEAVRYGSEIMEGVRVAGAAAGDGFVDAMTTRAQVLIKFAHQIRLKDTAQFRKDMIVNFLDSANDEGSEFARQYRAALTLRSPPTPYYNPDTGKKAGDILDEVDFEATRRALPAGVAVSPDFQQQLTDINANYLRDEQTLIHDDVINAMHEHTNMLATDVTICNFHLKRSKRSPQPHRRRSLIRPVRMATMFK